MIKTISTLIPGLDTQYIPAIQPNDSIEYHDSLVKEQLAEMAEAEKMKKSVNSHLTKDIMKLLNNPCKKLVEFGIGAGIEALRLKEEKFMVTGYDFSVTALNYLNIKRVATRQVDLNSIDVSSNQLTYQSQIAEDLNQTTNIFAINVLQYLNKHALYLLVWGLINHAKPDSVFFIVNTAYASSRETKQLESCQIGLLQGNYIHSFFAPRTDIAFLHYKRHRKPEGYQQRKGLPAGEYFDEVLVMRKR